MPGSLGARWPLLSAVAPAHKQSTTYPAGLTLLSIQEKSLFFPTSLAALVSCAKSTSRWQPSSAAASDCSQGPLEPGCRPLSAPVTALTTHRYITVIDQGFCFLFCHPLPTAGTAGTVEVPANDQKCLEAVTRFRPGGTQDMVLNTSDLSVQKVAQEPGGSQEVVLQSPYPLSASSVFLLWVLGERV